MELGRLARHSGLPVNVTSVSDQPAAAALLNAMILLFTVNAYPFAAFMLFLVDMLVIYGLAVYGGKQAA